MTSSITRGEKWKIYFLDPLGLDLSCFQFSRNKANYGRECASYQCLIWPISSIYRWLALRSTSMPLPISSWKFSGEIYELILSFPPVYRGSRIVRHNDDCSLNFPVNGWKCTQGESCGKPNAQLEANLDCALMLTNCQNDLDKRQLLERNQIHYSARRFISTSDGLVTHRRINVVSVLQKVF